MSLLEWLAEAAAHREAAGLTRRPSARGPAPDGGLIDLAGNDYLGLGRHPRVTAAAAAAASRWGAGAGASRLVTGNTTAHEALEAELAAFTGHETALVFSSGYLANLAAVTALAGRGDLVVSDRHVHASLVDACRLSRARVAVVGHLDLGAVDAVLATRPEPRALVITESVFSVLGDAAPLPELAAICAARDAVLVVDEAHALGVSGPGGRGSLAAAGLAGRSDVVGTLTLSKALGGQGGAVLGHRLLRDHLMNTARSFIFDTGLAPSAVASARAALEMLAAEPDRVLAVHRVAAALAAAAGVEAPTAAVLSVPLGDPTSALDAAAACAARGVRVGCFRPPSVPDGISRIRLTARATVDDAELAIATDVLADVLAGARAPLPAG